MAETLSVSPLQVMKAFNGLYGGRPVLIGTTSVEEAEEIATQLRKYAPRWGTQPHGVRELGLSAKSWGSAGDEHLQRAPRAAFTHPAMYLTLY